MRQILVFTIVLLAVVTGLQYARYFDHDIPEPQHFGQAPTFSFIDSTDTQFDSAALSGKAWILSFFFTSCKGICPAIQGKVAKLYRDFPELSVVSVTVDPERDTIEPLRDYAAKFNADPSRWHFLTGERAAISDLMETRLKLGELRAESPGAHTTRIVLVDRQNEIRGYFQGLEDEGIAKLEQAINKLAS